MSRGARALTLYQGIWAGIIEARPDLDNIDWIETWGRDPKHNWSRIDPAKMNLVSLMKRLDWHPVAGDYSGTARRVFTAEVGSETYWKGVIDGISVDGLQRFATWVINGASHATMICDVLTDDEVALIVSMAPIKQHAPAQWGTW